MKIKSVKSWKENFGLLRPYTIASKGTTYDVSNIIVEVSLENGIKGLGASAPTEIDEGETFAKCETILHEDNLKWLIGREIESIDKISTDLRNRMFMTPAARAGIDIALYDALALFNNVPLVDLLGRQYKALPTSITIGIKSIEESIDEAHEYGLSLIHI